MARKPDFALIKQAALEACPGLLHRWLPDGHQEGDEYKSINPTRPDNREGSFSINIRTGQWADFASGDTGGDLIDLYAWLFGMSNAEAAREIAAQLGLCDGESSVRKFKQHKASEKKEKELEPKPLFPVPESAPALITGDGKTVKLYNPKRKGTQKEWTRFKPSLVHPYRDREGELLGYVVRVDMPDKIKITPQITFCKLPDGRECWCIRPFPKPRPLYGLDDLAARPEATVLCVEGEKTRDAAKRLLPDLVIVAWPGGARGVHKVAWSDLFERSVMLLGDNDKAGLDAMIGYWKEKPNAQMELVKGVSHQLKGLAKVVVLTPADDLPEKWDLADAEEDGWDQARTRQWLAARFKEARKRGDLHPEKPPPKEPDLSHSLSGEDPPLPEQNGFCTGELIYDSPEEETPFRCLGFNRGRYYYLSKTAEQIIDLPASGHSKLNLLQIAPMHYWESGYPKKGGADWDMAANALIQLSHRKGVFRPEERRRGRGAWLDNGRSVLHMGDFMIVDGKVISPMEIESHYSYEGDTSLGIAPQKAATTQQAHRLIDICEAIPWEKTLSATCLAGWMIIAPVCGILNWRPHIWITGPSSSGKSTVLKDIVGNVVGPVALKAAAKTTEAGIRAALGPDALPVLFDEAEAEDERSAERMQGVLDLARVASSETGAKLYKGSATGAVQQFHTRSAFCFASINTAVKHYADETRITLLALSAPASDTEEERLINEEHYSRLMGKIHQTLTPDYAASLILRSVQNLQTLKENAETFSKAAAIVLKNRRVGDQIGALLAGAHLCHSLQKISLERAKDWIAKHDWSEHTSIGAESDDDRFLAHIKEYELTLTLTNGPRIERSVANLVQIALGYEEDTRISEETASDELCRKGIRVDKQHMLDPDSGYLYISTTSNHTRKMVRNTPWASSLRTSLLRLKGATKHKNNVRFKSLSTPAVKLPVCLFE